MQVRNRLALLAFTALVAPLFGVLPDALAQERKKVTIVYSTSNQDVSYQPYGALAQQLGWYRDEGLDVTIQTAANNGIIVQLLLTGQANFGMLGPDAILLAAAEKPVPLKSVYTIVRKMIFAAAVRDDSAAKTFSELKGKVIGMPSLSSQLVPFVGSRLAEFGASINDVKLVETGYGVASMEALKTGKIDAFIGWPGLFASYQNAGYRFRVIPDAPWQKDYFGIGLAVTNDYHAKNPDVIAKIGRGLAKSAVLMKSNPDVMIEPFWKAYPANARMPGEDREKAMDRERNVLRATANQMLIDELPESFAWGSQDLATWERHLKRLKETKLVPEAAKINVADYFTDAFTAQYNAFDRATVPGLKK